MESPTPNKVNTAKNIVRQAEAALERDPRVNLHKRPLKISLDPDNTLVLEGEVEGIAAKKLALESAAAIPGVNGIVDRLRIVPSTAMGDGELGDHVRDALIEEPALSNCRVRLLDNNRRATHGEPAVAPDCCVDIAVKDGVVTLNGRVKSLSHKRLAGVLAWWVPGSRDVVNGLEVVPVQDDSDSEITEAVRLILEKDPLVDATKVRVTSRDSTVTLEGLVVNAVESETAENDAWYILGVNRVVNLLARER